MSFYLIETVILIIVSISSVMIGSWVYQNDRKNPLNKWFAIISLLIVLWVNSAYFAANLTIKETSLFLYRINSAVVSLFLASAYIFSVFYFIKKKSSVLFKFVFSGSLLFFFLSLFTNLIVNNVVEKEWGIGMMFGPLGDFYKLFALFVTVAIIYQLSHYYITAEKKEKLKIQYFFIGIALLAVFNIIFNIIIPFITSSVRLQHVGDFSAIFFLGLTAYAIVKQKLFGIRIVFTTLFVALISILLLVDLLVFTDIFVIKLFKMITLLAFIVFGYALAKSVTKEVKQREKVEKLSTKLATTNIRLEAAYKKLKELDKAKSEFISIVSHQLRTPLTAVKGYLSMIKEGNYGKIPKKVENKIENIYNGNERLINLVNDMLSVSRIETGKVDIGLEKIQIKDTVSEIVKNMSIIAKDKNLYLRFKNKSRRIPKANIDIDKIHQVILNIIDNALKYTKKGGVVVEVNKKEEKGVKSVVVSISDTGEGMTKEECLKMFYSFSRGSAGSLLHSEGAGLGLYVSKKFVEMHDGNIWVGSEGKGKGSTFFIELPIKGPKDKKNEKNEKRNSNN